MLLLFKYHRECICYPYRFAVSDCGQPFVRCRRDDSQCFIIKNLMYASYYFGINKLARFVYCKHHCHTSMNPLLFSFSWISLMLDNPVLECIGTTSIKACIIFGMLRFKSLRDPCFRLSFDLKVCYRPMNPALRLSVIIYSSVMYP